MSKIADGVEEEEFGKIKIAEVQGESVYNRECLQVQEGV